MLRKVLVANRGEIAIRAFRAAYELGIRTVVVYTPDTRSYLHRQKADEVHGVGEVGHPVRAYLDAQTLVETAKRVGADVIYPDYGFLSESATFARACEKGRIRFAGAGAHRRQIARPRAAAKAGVSLLCPSEPVEGGEEALAAAEAIGYPVFVKAAKGAEGYVPRT